MEVQKLAKPLEQGWRVLSNCCFPPKSSAYWGEPGGNAWKLGMLTMLWDQRVQGLNGNKTKSKTIPTIPAQTSGERHGRF